MDILDLFSVISGFCSILSLIISLIVLNKVSTIRQDIKGKKNITAGNDVNIGK